MQNAVFIELPIAKLGPIWYGIVLHVTRPTLVNSYMCVLLIYCI